MAYSNLETHEVGQMQITTYPDGSWMAPRGAHPGGNRLIDYCLVASSTQHMVKLEWDLQGPWASPRASMKGAVKHAGSEAHQAYHGAADGMPTRSWTR
eukprot:188060-Pyramimonas_sp.AAC.1